MMDATISKVLSWEPTGDTIFTAHFSGQMEGIIREKRFWG
jgi:hypothetical protein